MVIGMYTIFSTIGLFPQYRVDLFRGSKIHYIKVFTTLLYSLHSAGLEIPPMTSNRPHRGKEA